MSEEAITNTRKRVEEIYGAEYLQEKFKQHKAKSTSAQEAHEAIRPAGDFKTPENTSLSGKELELYKMIWIRTLACQMKPAKKVTSTILASVDETVFSTSGTRIVFPGYLLAYSSKEDLKDVILPDLNVGSKLYPLGFDIKDHETKAVARYNEASLIQTLEKEGIGRPSTYASIIATIQERRYVQKQGSALTPTFIGMAVTQLLERYFPKLVDYKFTSQMENSLDDIACGKMVWTDFLKGFYLGRSGLMNLVKEKEDQIKPDEIRTIKPVHLDKQVEIKVGRYGPYIVCKASEGKGSEPVHASIPEEIAPADLTKSR